MFLYIYFFLIQIKILCVTFFKNLYIFLLKIINIKKKDIYQ